MGRSGGGHLFCYQEQPFLLQGDMPHRGAYGGFELYQFLEGQIKVGDLCFLFEMRQELPDGCSTIHKGKK
jgi:hypothetical protein